ncbi:allene oxide cyclase barrel-like domain-containing protein [Cellulomonas aerilata]|uniref:Allene oxide cyclase barrel-like domain-containing protein n=1 Tax=Cellulomonas aerilata TaxID=515326 RepID=A0A512DF30_9CELL|nr:dirigent protein [Cellulomonas aerilata]GEO35094.1 hypothetical protein CAE01nite_28190 [Cellulomonas aerilata]
MRRSLTAALLAGLGVLALGGSSSAADSADADRSSSGRAATLRYDVEFTSGFFLLDFGPHGVREVASFQDPFSPSRGDQVVFEDTLLRRGEPVASGGGTCTVTAVVPSDTPLRLSCVATYELPGGQVAVQGRTTNAPEKTLAVVGGTGRYAGAAGEFTLTEFGDGTGSAVFRLRR